ncbi:hypothetical protein QBC43DRAFT_333652 [Cladorrhinum sp. PSN259]|nr:hypothetical protein QBC43DRAFT_333652 [Cladorrhinum sp. PSN259]
MSHLVVCTSKLAIAQVWTCSPKRKAGKWAGSATWPFSGAGALYEIDILGRNWKRPGRLSSTPQYSVCLRQRTENATYPVPLVSFEYLCGCGFSNEGQHVEGGQTNNTSLLICVHTCPKRRNGSQEEQRGVFWLWVTLHIIPQASQNIGTYTPTRDLDSTHTRAPRMRETWDCELGVRLTRSAIEIPVLFLRYLREAGDWRPRN